MSYFFLCIVTLLCYSHFKSDNDRHETCFISSFVFDLSTVFAGYKVYNLCSKLLPSQWERQGRSPASAKSNQESTQYKACTFVGCFGFLQGICPSKLDIPALLPHLRHYDCHETAIANDQCPDLRRGVCGPEASLFNDRRTKCIGPHPGRYARPFDWRAEGS